MGDTITLAELVRAFDDIRHELRDAVEASCTGRDGFAKEVGVLRSVADAIVGSAERDVVTDAGVEWFEREMKLRAIAESKPAPSWVCRDTLSPPNEFDAEVVSRMRQKAEAWLHRERLREACAAPGFVLLRAFGSALHTLDVVRSLGGCATIVGPSGVGKSAFVEHYARESRDVLLLQATEVNTPQKLDTEVRYRCRGGLYRQIELVIVDGAESVLTTKMADSFRDAMRSYVRALALVGDHRLECRLCAGEYAWFTRRLTGHCEVAGLEMCDVQRLFPSVSEAVAKALVEYSGGLAARAVTLMQVASEIALREQTAVTTKMLRDAVKAISGADPTETAGGVDSAEDLATGVRAIA